MQVLININEITRKTIEKGKKEQRQCNNLRFQGNKNATVKKCGAILENGNKP